MNKRLFAENTRLGQAILKGEGKEIVVQLLACLKKLGLTGAKKIKTVIEQGMGGEILPATVFFESGIRYYGIDMHEEIITHSFLPKLREHLKSLSR